MARPLRLEFSGALYHLTARGNARADSFANDEDRRLFLELLRKEISQQQDTKGATLTLFSRDSRTIRT
jgi:hypothetical protein